MIVDFYHLSSTLRTFKRYILDRAFTIPVIWIHSV
nr:MAG TPA: hypothetical protein [Caudoviricetes sp.]